ncbi:MAG: sensor histidine kinase [Bacteriovoracia bacterium]
MRVALSQNSKLQVFSAISSRLRTLLGVVADTSGRIFLFPHKEGSTERAKLLWLVRLRWLAIGAFSALSVPALASGVVPASTFPVFLGIIALLFLVNLFTQLFLKNGALNATPLLTFVQLSFDLTMLSSLLFLAGSFANPFVALFFLHASLGAILIRGRIGVVFLAFAHMFLCVLQLRSLIDRNETALGALYATFAAFHFLLICFWLVMRSLGSYLDRQQEKQLHQRHLLEKQDRLRSLGALAAGFSHEFASPLHAAKLRLERLNRKTPSEDVTEALEALHSCETVLHQMNASQLDARAFRFNSVVVSDLLRDVVDSWQEQNPTCIVKVRAEASFSGKLPPLNFAQVVLNLLDNAAAAAPGEEILVNLQREDGTLRLSIKDNGAGIPRSVLERLGEPFITTKPQGTGLGLYVSQLFAQSLGGDLRVENSDLGATVFLEWPEGENSA